jgi:RimJ/RimL family protein N-acetyltransferase
VDAGPELRTERLLLRRWCASDVDAFTAINADRSVMEHFPAPLAATQSAELLRRIEACFEANGYGLWAVELPGESSLAGCVGIVPVDVHVAFAPAVELAWRLAPAFWRRGLAREAAAAAIRFVFADLGLAELVAYTAAGNLRSRRLKERLGMSRDPAEDFVHPKLTPEHPLAQHVLYRIDPARWRRGERGCS